jgi:hypothetical protein
VSAHTHSKYLKDAPSPLPTVSALSQSTLTRKAVFNGSTSPTTTNPAQLDRPPTRLLDKLLDKPNLSQFKSAWCPQQQSTATVYTCDAYRHPIQQLQPVPALALIPILLPLQAVLRMRVLYPRLERRGPFILHAAAASCYTLPCCCCWRRNSSLLQQQCSTRHANSRSVTVSVQRAKG